MPTKDHTQMAAVAPLNARMIQSLEMVVPRTELLETLCDCKYTRARQDARYY